MDQNITTTNGSNATLSPKEQARIEFYKTYDVMIGVRIAATLGGFFGLMVLLVIYKSKCKSRYLSDENIAAAVSAAVGKDEELERTLEKTLTLYGVGRGLEPMSTPYGQPRFSSLGEGYNLFEPPVRKGPRDRISLPTFTPFLYRSPIFSRAKIEPLPSTKRAQPMVDLLGGDTRGRLLSDKCIPTQAPLVSISSCALTSLDQEKPSCGSDSVFLDEELIDTEDEIDEFSTDSDTENGIYSIASMSKPDLCDSNKTDKTNSKLTLKLNQYSPPESTLFKEDQQHGQLILDNCNKKCPCKSFKIKAVRSYMDIRKGSRKLNIDDLRESKHNENVPFSQTAAMSISCDHLVKTLQQYSSQIASSKSMVDNCSWSRETLF